MGYTRNFEYRVSPQGGQRAGRFISPAAVDIVIGAPIKVNTGAAANDLGLQEIQLATGEQAPLKGLSGIADFEYKGQEGWAGDDPYLTTFSDKATVPRAKALQMVSGLEVKVCFRNTSTVTFLNTRSYTGRIMVNQGSGSTPHVVVGDYLTPGPGDDTNGYWQKPSSTANAWLVVTKVDTTRGEVEARMVF